MQSPTLSCWPHWQRSGAPCRRSSTRDGSSRSSPRASTISFPHDRLVVDHLDEGGRTFTVFAEHAPPGLILHDEHYTTTFAPQARYIVDEWVLRFVFAGEALLIHDFSTDPRVSNANPFHRKMNEKGIRSGSWSPWRAAAG